MGVKDIHAGVIKARADWSFFHSWSRGPTPRVMFLCDACLESLTEAQAKPLVGIDRPEHASDFWKPSIMHHIRMTALENNRQEKATQVPTDYETAVTQFVMAQMRRREASIPRRGQP
jgi:hypothetical protein